MSAVYRVPEEYFVKLGIEEVSQPLLHAAKATLISSGGAFDAFTSRRSPPLLEERLILIDGLIDKPGLPVNILNDYTNHGGASGGFFYEGEPISVTTKELTIIPMHRAPNSPWLQSSKKWIIAGAEGSSSFRLRYEDSEHGGRPTTEEQDLFFHLNSEVAANQDPYSPTEQSDDDAKLWGYCVSLWQANGDTCNTETFIRGRTFSEIKSKAEAFKNNYNFGGPVFKARYYQLRPGRC